MSDMLKLMLHRPRINVSKALQAAALILASLSLFLSYQYFVTEGGPSLRFDEYKLGSIFSSNHTGQSNSPAPPVASANPVFEKDGNATLLALATPYLKAIMDPEDTTYPRLECPRLNNGRYEYLRNYKHNGSKFDMQYFIALDLHQNAELLPRLIGSIVEVMRFLGPSKTSLSIVEGGSDDGTYEILKLLRPKLHDLGTKYWFVSSDINTREGDRIKKLAELRNLALAPLVNFSAQDSTVVFLNDVAICPDDILELIHQLLWQVADMTCAMDWTYVGPDPTFYDVWIARDIKGDSFFEIPPDGNWNSAWNLFWNNEETKQLYNSHKPFQVFSCWNGAVAFTAEVLNKTKFRSAKTDECPGGEPKLFCTDLWAEGYGRIAVVPSVNLEYSDEAGRKIKALKGYVQALVEGDEGAHKIQWQENPPEKVKCIPAYDRQTWRPWDQRL